MNKEAIEKIKLDCSGLINHLLEMHGGPQNNNPNVSTLRDGEKLVYGILLHYIVSLINHIETLNNSISSFEKSSIKSNNKLFWVGAISGIACVISCVVLFIS